MNINKWVEGAVKSSKLSKRAVRCRGTLKLLSDPIPLTSSNWVPETKNKVSIAQFKIDTKKRDIYPPGTYLIELGFVYKNKPEAFIASGRYVLDIKPKSRKTYTFLYRLVKS